MGNFILAYKKTMGVEGGYANDPLDTGGETYKGIARKKNPAWNGWTAIDAIKKRYGSSAAVINKYAGSDPVLQSNIQAFYKKNYWDVNKLDQLKYQSICEELFDTGVNMGSGIAAKHLQEALNLCNKNGVSYPDITVDGDIGPTTINMVNNKAHEIAVLNTLNMLQGERYLQIMRANKSQERFWQSWLSRTIVSGKW